MYFIQQNVMNWWPRNNRRG